MNVKTNITMLDYDYIVLDIDQTLVSSSEYYSGAGHQIKFLDMDNDPVYLWVHKRPGLDEFLKYCFANFKVGVWSAGQHRYVEKIVKCFFPQRPEFVYNWCDCDRDSGRVQSMIYKKLNNIPFEGRILMIDDREDVLEMCERIDAYIITAWAPHMTDDYELYELMR